MYLITAIVSLTVAAAGLNSSHCRCVPHQPCWPSDAEWQGLNKSVSGRLVSIKPVGWVCHDPTFNDGECQNATVVNTDSIWRREHPGAVQYPNWEAWPLVNQSCYIETPRSVPCGQGKISEYSAIVETAEDIQAAVQFAKTHNVRLVIKNSGHDYLGRSTAPESLQIATFKLNHIEFSDYFVPSGAGKEAGVGNTITIGAGTVLYELYNALEAKGRIAVMGSSHTVGAAGGFVQGGGHSPIGPWKGMASDNVIEFEVVTAKGDLITANDYQNQDLFWALRGGGGGTFGVVTKATMRTFDEAPMVVVNVNISTPLNASSNYWPAVAAYSSAVPMLNDNMCSGYFYMLPNLTFPGVGDISAVDAFVLCADQSDTSQVDRKFKPILASIGDMTGITVDYKSTAFPKTIMALRSLLSGDADTTGDIAILGSRLVSRDLILSKGGPMRFANALSQLPANNGDSFIGHMVAGGQVAENGAKVDSALNPAWRRTAVHVVWTRRWAPGATPDEIRAVEDQLTQREVPIFKALEPGCMGAYLNEADPNEADFQETFWGPNYAHLYSIKQKWDPDGLFIARKGVGSEDWDDPGLCRLTN